MQSLNQDFSRPSVHGYSVGESRKVKSTGDPSVLNHRRGVCCDKGAGGAGEECSTCGSSSGGVGRVWALTSQHGLRRTALSGLLAAKSENSRFSCSGPCSSAVMLAL